MSSDGEFRAAAAVFSMYGGLFRSVAAEIGLEKALVLHARQGARVGEGIAELTRMRLGGSANLNMEVFGTSICRLYESLGFEQTMEQDAHSVSCKCTRCPMYEGLRNAGIDHDTIGEMCARMSLAEGAALRSKFPNLWGAIEFRENADGICVEKFVKVW